VGRGVAAATYAWGDAACGDVMSNVASVITTTTNTVVDSANAAVSIGRWSNLAIIAFCSFLSVWEGGSHCYAGLCDPKNESRGCYTRSNNRSL
jgi:hypothetical protein